MVHRHLLLVATIEEPSLSLLMSGFFFSRAEIVRDQSHIMDCGILELMGRMDYVLLPRVDLLVARSERLGILIPSPAAYGTLGSLRTPLGVMLLLRYLALVCKVGLPSHSLKHRVVLVVGLPL